MSWIKDHIVFHKIRSEFSPKHLTSLLNYYALLFVYHSRTLNETTNNTHYRTLRIVH